MIANLYRVVHLVEDSLLLRLQYEFYRMGLFVSYLGWVDFDLAPSCPIAQPILPNINLLKQYRAGSGITKNQGN